MLSADLQKFGQGLITLSVEERHSLSRREAEDIGAVMGIGRSKLRSLLQPAGGSEIKAMKGHGRGE